MKIKPRRNEAGCIEIGPRNTSFGRCVVLVNPIEADWTKHRYVLCFGAMGTLNLSVWANSLDDALEEAAEYLAEHAKGHITAHDSQELIDLLKEACEEAGHTYPEGFDALEDEEKYAIQDSATADLTYTESGYLTSYEWGIALEDPSRAELDEFLYPPGYGWEKERAAEC